MPVGLDPEGSPRAGAVWAANVEDETVSRIDPTDTAARDRTIPVGGYPGDVTVGSGAVWVGLGALASSCASTLSRIRPRSPSRRSVETPPAPDHRR